MFKSKKKNPSEGLRLTFPSETESAKFQFDPGTAAAEILMALNAGESEMCAQAKDSSRRFSWSSPAACAAAAGGASPLLTRMRSDRGDEDGTHRSSLSLRGKAVRLIRFKRQRGLLSCCSKTHKPAGEATYILAQRPLPLPSPDHVGLGTQVTLLRRIRTSGWAALSPRYQASPAIFLHLFCTCKL